MEKEQHSTFIDPTLDYGFKILYGMEGCDKALIELLEHVIPEKRIVSLEYLPTEQQPFNEDGKRTICDVKCQDQHGDYFIVEMQRNAHAHMGDRLLAYSGDVISRLAEKGKDYSDIKSAYVICITNFTFTIPGEDVAYTKKSIRRAFLSMEDSGIVLSDKIKFIILQLTPCAEYSEKWLERWAWHMRNLGRAESEPLITSKSDSHFVSMYERARRSQLTETILKNYDRMLRDEKMIQAEKDYAVKLAREAALAEGKAEGIAEGKAEGKVEGIAEGKASIAKAMLEKGFPKDVIVEVTGLSSGELSDL